MIAKLLEWGNSLAMTLRQSLAKALHQNFDDGFDLSRIKDAIVNRKRSQLDRLLDRVEKQQEPAFVDFQPVGKEVI